MFFRCNHLLYFSLEVFSDLWVIIIEFFKLPLVLDPIGEVLDHLSVCDIIDLGSLLYEAAIVFLEGLV